MTEKLSNLLIVLTVAVTTSGAPAGTLYVDDDALPGGDGLTWNTAYRFLQDALTHAAGEPAVNEVRVAHGTHRPDRDEANPDGLVSDCCQSHGTPGCDNSQCETTVCGIDPFCCDTEWDDNCVQLAIDQCTVCSFREATFQLINGVAILGGYAGLSNPVDPNARDIVLYETILSGDLAANDGVDFINNDENSYHVVRASGTGATAVLDGFTIRGGHANGPAWPELHSSGAGMINDGGSPTILQCRFEANQAAEYGGAMENVFGASPTITDTVFENNASWFTGGGLDFFSDTSPLVTGCTFTNNVTQNPEIPSIGAGLYIGTGGNAVVTGCVFGGNSSRAGTGIFTEFTANGVTISDCEFTGNTALFGGGIYCSAGSSPTISGCTFTGNAAIISPLDDTGGYGAALVNFDNSSPDIIDCVFTMNTADREGGAIFNESSSSPVLSNCILSGNTAAGGGGIRDSRASSSTLNNCTFTMNSADGAGGAVSAGSATSGPMGVTTLNNCILWSNTASLGSEIALIGAFPVEMIVAYSDVQGGVAGIYVQPGFTLTWGDGNIDADPLFVDANNGDFQLSSGSPCVDAADNTAVPEDIDTDIDGNPRFVDDPGTVDTGNGDPPIVDMGAYEFQLLCPWDLDGSGTVSTSDLLALLGAWGTDPGGPPDFDGNGDVSTSDLLALLANWGACP